MNSPCYASWRVGCPLHLHRFLHQGGQPSGGVPLGDDVVPLENTPGLVAGQGHGDPLRDATSDHVADRRPTHIVEDSTGNACGLAGFPPRVANVPDWFPGPHLRRVVSPRPRAVSPPKQPKSTGGPAPREARRPERAPISGHLPCQLVLAISVEDVRAPPSPGPLTPRLEFVLAIDR